MALWGNKDNIGAGGTVNLNYATRIVTGYGTTFGQVGAAKTGDIIRFGVRGGTGLYFGSAVIVGIASTQQITIGSTANLSGTAIGNTSFTINESPISAYQDSQYARKRASVGLNTADPFVYGVSNASLAGAGNTSYKSGIHAGWVGIQTYVDMHGKLRVKKETLVAMSGIQTGNQPRFPGQK